jgi:hypothetical protein
MVRRTNKSITETLSSAGSAALSSKEDLELQRKITIATEGFGTTKFCELILTLVLVIHLPSDLKNLEHMTICAFYIHG